MDLEGIILSEISQTKTNTRLFHLYVESKKQKMNKQNRNRLIDTENKLVVSRGERGWGMGEIGERE